jgi:hypothetical protein
MKPAVWVFASIILLATTISNSQDHAPTLEQCRADEKLWWDELNNVPAAISRLPFSKLVNRFGEMTDCGSVDDDRIADYNRVAGSLTLKMQNRLLHFVDRHHLMGQFMAEDAAGKR